MTPRFQSKAKSPDEWKKEGAKVYFINTKESGFPLYIGRIEKIFDDGTFGILAVCQTKGRSKIPKTMKVESKLIHEQKS